jgi:hypothetical protein
MVRLERRRERLAPRKQFLSRLVISISLAASLAAVSLLAGMIGYHYFERMSWTDAYLNAAMILSGMGPVGQLDTQGGKLFAGTYAIYSGLIVVIATGIVLAPVLHRFLHRFHLDEEDDEQDRKQRLSQQGAAASPHTRSADRPKPRDK